MDGSWQFPVAEPKPDFEQLLKVLSGEKAAEKVHLVELFADIEIVRVVLKDVLGIQPVLSPADDFEEFYKQNIEFWYRMGYDFVRVSGGLSFPKAKHLQAADTAQLSRGTRSWIDEGIGVITSWEDFESYPWPDPSKSDLSHYEFCSRHLPEGMQMMVCPCSGIFEIASEHLLGFEGMSYLLYDAPDLVEAVFNRVGEILYGFYKNIVSLDNVGGFFQGDDLGFKTATILRPQVLRRLVLPWHKRLAELAHDNGKVYWLHSCGNLSEIMEDLIKDVGIDGIHSFQDVIYPVTEFHKRYGDRVAALGGVDVDVMCQADEAQLRQYVRHILDECMPTRFALGSGNTVANYVPVESYLTMLDEAAAWTG